MNGAPDGVVETGLPSEPFWGGLYVSISAALLLVLPRIAMDLPCRCVRPKTRLSQYYRSSKMSPLLLCNHRLFPRHNR